MSRVITRSLKLLIVAAGAILATSATAQINGVPASVTSIGFGGHFDRAPGVPASVTSLGPNGFGQGSINFRTCCFSTGFNHVRQNPPLFQRHQRGGFFPVAVPYYTPGYAPVIVVEQPAAFSDYADEEGRAGPTIFDRRGRRERVVSPAPEPAPEPAPAVSEPLEVTDQPETVLIFRDGHRVEIRNYAIVGDTLYDFTSARHKISLADLDLTATARENDDRGIDFHVPATAGGSQQ